MATRCHLYSRQVVFQNRSFVYSTVRKFTKGLRELSQPLRNEQPTWMSEQEAVRIVKSGDTLFIQGAAATPRILVPALAEHGKKSGLKNVTVCHIHTVGAAEYNQPDMTGIFRSNSFFVGANSREAIHSGRGDFVPVFLSDLSLFFHQKIVPVDVALVQVTPADKHGYCSLGVSVEVTTAALKHAKYIIGQVNTKMPRTFGHATVHTSHFDVLVEGEKELPEHKVDVLTEAELTIGRLISDNLVEDGATLQMGIGSIPEAVLGSLRNHKDLGIHSEMLVDGIVDLVNVGCISNKHKAFYNGKIVGSFAVGTRKLYDFLDDNPSIVMLDGEVVNHQDNISVNPKVTAINSCIEVDLTGQVCSDSIGTRIFSGAGGQVDFLRGAATGKDRKGKPILAMPSCTIKEETKIVPFIKQGGGVVTSRSHIHYIVTEYGIADLFGKNLRQRAYHLIQIAHPKHREGLEKAAYECLKCMPSP